MRAFVNRDRTLKYSPCSAILENKELKSRDVQASTSYSVHLNLHATVRRDNLANLCPACTYTKRGDDRYDASEYSPYRHLPPLE